jgi:hypothetical protein
MAQTDEHFTIEEAADYLGKSVVWLYRLRQEGRGPVCWRDGRRLTYPRVELDLYRARERQRTMRGDGVVTA